MGRFFFGVIGVVVCAVLALVLLSGPNRSHTPAASTAALRPATTRSAVSLAGATTVKPGARQPSGPRPEPFRASVYRSGLTRAAAWARRVTGARIGVAGAGVRTRLRAANPANVVSPIVGPAVAGARRPPASCAQWRTAVTDGRYRYLVLAPDQPNHPSVSAALGWLNIDPSVHLVLNAGGGVVVLAVSGPLHPGSCAAQSTADIGH